MTRLPRVRPAAAGAAAAAAVLAALYLLAARRLPVGVLNDDAANVLLARALLHGRFAFPGGLGLPFQFLPGLPLLLVPAVLFGGLRPWLLRAVPLAAGALTPWLTWRLARRRLGPGASAAAALLTAANPVLLGLGGLVMPYAPYLALSLWLVDFAPDAESPRAFALLTAAAAFAILLRPHGVVLAAVLALVLWRRFGARRAALFLTGAALPSALWLLAGRLAAGPAISDYPSVWRQNVAVLGDPLVQFRHAVDLLDRLLGAGLFGLPGAPTALRASLALLVLLAAAAGARRLLRRDEDPRAFAAAAYLAGVLLLHLTWRWVSLRYLFPLVPFVWILAAAAAEPRLSPRPAAGAALTALLLAAPLRLDLFLARRGRDARPGYEPRTVAWIRANVPPDGRLSSVGAYALALNAGRACEPQDLHPDREWLSRMRAKGVRWVHVRVPLPGDEFAPADVPPNFGTALAAWLTENKLADEVFAAPDEGTMIFRLKDETPDRTTKTQRREVPARR
ncbi:MAG: glycosyltransferase family 39 protein [Elusimicrobia bacterium]|nr:glycosyltransferase family 39 protein [Elusimicrobiota bacterium]